MCAGSEFSPVADVPATTLPLQQIEPSLTTVSRVYIKPAKKFKDALFHVRFGEETLIEHSRDPVFESCRALMARGITGQLVAHWEDNLCDSRAVDIELGSQLHTTASDLGLFTRNYLPFAPEYLEQ
jgi:hypothetical protein